MLLAYNQKGCLTFYPVKQPFNYLILLLPTHRIPYQHHNLVQI